MKVASLWFGGQANCGTQILLLSLASSSGGGQGLEYEPGQSKGAWVVGVVWALDNETLTSLHSCCFHHHHYQSFWNLGVGASLRVMTAAQDLSVGSGSSLGKWGTCVLQVLTRSTICNVLGTIKPNVSLKKRERKHMHWIEGKLKDHQSPFQF